MNSLQTQLCASRGFTGYLAANPIDDIDASLLGILNSYECELERQLACHPGTRDWFAILALAAMEAKLLHDEMVDGNSALAAFRPENEPTSIEQMKLRLLADAIKLFQKSCAELSTQFETPKAVVEINTLIERVLSIPFQEYR
ncbi:MAG TPA: hypothetical protein VGF96_05900 [Terracidiphilus sp.]